MSFIPRLISSGAGLFKSATGGTLGRMALGGTIGAMVGGARALNSDDPNQQTGSIMTGALLGAMGGAATRLISPAIRYGKSGAFTTGMPIGMKPLGFAAKMAGKVSWGATKFAFKNPRTTLGIGGGVLGAYVASNTLGSQNSSLSYDMNDYNAPTNTGQEDSAMSQMNTGLSPMGAMTTGTSVRAGRIHRSTFGLTQGLHRGRH